MDRPNIGRMPTQDDDLEPRVTALEHQMTELREHVTHAADDAAAARVLAGGADRDVSEVRAELRAHRRSLNALGQTQAETRRAVRELQGEVRELQGEVRAGFAMTGAGFAAIAERLDRAIGEG